MAAPRMRDVQRAARLVNHVVWFSQPGVEELARLARSADRDIYAETMHALGINPAADDR